MCGNALLPFLVNNLKSKSRVEGTTFDVKDPKKIRGQESTFQGQTLSGPRTGNVEAKDREHNFSKLWSANFPQFLITQVLKILHFVKFLMII